MVSRAPRKLM